MPSELTHEQRKVLDFVLTENETEIFDLLGKQTGPDAVGMVAVRLDRSGTLAFKLPLRPRTQIEDIERYRPDAIFIGYSLRNGLETTRVRLYGDGPQHSGVWAGYNQAGRRYEKKANPREAEQIIDSTDQGRSIAHALYTSWRPVVERPGWLEPELLAGWLYSLSFVRPSGCVRAAWICHATLTHHQMRGELSEVNNGRAEMSSTLAQALALGATQIAEDMSTPTDAGLIRSLLLARFMMLAYWANGNFPSYELTSSFLAALTLTDPSDLPIGDLHFPHYACFLRLPAGFLTAQPNTPLSNQDCNGLWIIAVADKVTNTWKFVFEACSTSGDTFLTSFELPLSAATVGDWLTDERFRERPFAREHLRLAINVGLYLTSKVAAEPKPGRETHLKTHQGKGEVHPQVTVLDRNVKLDPEAIHLARQILRGEQKRRDTFKIQARIYITAHWRHRQVCGSRKKLPDGRWSPWPDRRSVWIAPHVKREGDTVIKHVYALDRTKKVDEPQDGSSREVGPQTTKEEK